MQVIRQTQPSSGGGGSTNYYFCKYYDECIVKVCGCGGMKLLSSRAPFVRWLVRASKNSWANWITYVTHYSFVKLTYEHTTVFADPINFLFVSITHPFIIFIVSEWFAVVAGNDRVKLFDIWFYDGGHHHTGPLVIFRLIFAYWTVIGPHHIFHYGARKSTMTDRNHFRY